MWTNHCIPSPVTNTSRGSKQVVDGAAVKTLCTEPRYWLKGILACPMERQPFTSHLCLFQSPMHDARTEEIMKITLENTFNRFLFRICVYQSVIFVYHPVLTNCPACVSAPPAMNSNELLVMMTNDFPGTLQLFLKDSITHQ